MTTDDSLDQLGEEVRRALGDAPSPTRRVAQRRAVAAVRPHAARLGRRWVLPVAAAAAVALAWWAWPRSEASAPASAKASAPELAPAVEVDRWVRAPRTAPTDVDLGTYARARLLAGGRARVRESADGGARLWLENGTLELEAEGGKGREWIVSAGPFETVVLGTALAVTWDPDGEALEVRVDHGAVQVAGAHLGIGGMRVEAGSVLEASLPQRSATVRERTAEGDEPPVPRFEGRIPDVEKDPVLARTWAEYYIQAHPDGDRLSMARELLLRSYADEIDDPAAKAAAQAYLEAMPEGEHVDLARAILAHHAGE